MIKHVMCDLETLGTQPGSVVVSIGLVMFEPRGHAVENYSPTGTMTDIRGIYKTLKVGISIASAMRAGLRVDASTIEWWLKQSPDAISALFYPHPIDLRDALRDVDAFVNRQAGDEVRLWGHGANFDSVLLAICYDATERRPFWSYSEARCTRTIYDLAGIDVNSFRDPTTHHDALADALAQVAALRAAFAKIAVQP